MRTKFGMAVVVSGLLLAGACGDDSGGGEGALGDDPTLEECQAALRTVLGRIEVPDGFDSSDGVDDDEREAAADALDDAAEGFFDPDDEDHPCNDRFDEMSEQETTEFMVGLDLDPEVLAMLGSQATSEFTPIEDEL